MVESLQDVDLLPQVVHLLFGLPTLGNKLEGDNLA